MSRDVFTPEVIRRSCIRDLVALGIVAAASLPLAEQGDEEAKDRIWRCAQLRYDILRYAEEQGMELIDGSLSWRKTCQ